MDHGPIILQEAFKLTEKETLESLEERVHKVEHKLYPKAVALFVDGRLKITGRRVKILDKPACPPLTAGQAAGGPAGQPQEPPNDEARPEDSTEDEPLAA